MRLAEVDFSEVRIDDPFWSPRIETNRDKSLRHVFEQLQERGAIRNFEIAAGSSRGSFSQPWWSDSDVYKWLEGASYTLFLSPNAELERRVDEIISKIAAAQEEDGYLDTFIQIVRPRDRWENLGFFHELFCAGHLIEAAVAHYESTGKRTLLDVATRIADNIDSVFGPGKSDGLPGHEEVELALVRLYRATGDKKYLKLATHFVDRRGSQPSYFEQEYRRLPKETQVNFLGRDISISGLHQRFFLQGPNFDTRYCQDHLPIRQQRQATGHSVRAMYLYSAMTDVVHETDDRELLAAVYGLHDDVTQKKMYVTGGVGPSGRNEGFTEEYDLPNESAYQETCASIGTMLWNHRLLKLTGRSHYADLLEQTLYNTFLGAVSFSGDTFCYVNPLYNQRERVRREWFSVPCCPTNMVRLFPSLGRYIYGRSDDGLWVHLFIGSEVETKLDDGSRLNLKLSTEYPWEGRVQLVMGLDTPAEFALRLRIPGWASDFSLRVNGENTNAEMSHGYVRLFRTWSSNDTVELSFPIEVQKIVAHPRVKQNQSRVVLRRGPLVYCLEQTDHDTDLDEIFVGTNFKANLEFDSQLVGGVLVLTGDGVTPVWQNGRLYGSLGSCSWQDVAIKAIPYFAWGNRRMGKMKVWLPLAFNTFENAHLSLPKQATTPRSAGLN